MPVREDRLITDAHAHFTPSQHGSHRWLPAILIQPDSSDLCGCRWSRERQQRMLWFDGCSAGDYTAATADWSHRLVGAAGEFAALALTQRVTEKTIRETR